MQILLRSVTRQADHHEAKSTPGTRCSAGLLHIVWYGTLHVCHQAALLQLQQLPAAYPLLKHAYAAQAGTSAVLHQADLQGLLRLQTSDAVGCTRLLKAEGYIGCEGCKFSI